MCSQPTFVLFRAQLIGVGYNFQDGGVSLLDLRFADDILIFVKSYEEIGHVLDVLVVWFFFYFCDGLFTVKEAKQATLQLPRSFFHRRSF